MTTEATTTPPPRAPKRRSLRIADGLSMPIDDLIALFGGTLYEYTKMKYPQLSAGEDDPPLLSKNPSMLAVAQHITDGAFGCQTDAFRSLFAAYYGGEEGKAFLNVQKTAEKFSLHACTILVPVAAACTRHGAGCEATKPERGAPAGMPILVRIVGDAKALRSDGKLTTAGICGTHRGMRRAAKAEVAEFIRTFPKRKLLLGMMIRAAIRMDEGEEDAAAAAF